MLLHINYELREERDELLNDGGLTNFVRIIRGICFKFAVLFFGITSLIGIGSGNRFLDNLALLFF